MRLMPLISPLISTALILAVSGPLFAQEWLNGMIARKLVERIDVPLNVSLRDRVSKAAKSRKVAAILDKDCHLIEAALATDKIVISIETSCRDHFRAVAHAVAELRGIGWVNPADPAESAIAWLETGGGVKRCQRLAPKSVGE